MSISWQPDTQVLSYIFTHDNGTIYSDTKEIDLTDVLDSNFAHWGFTSSTGGIRNEQIVRFDNNSICAAYEILAEESCLEDCAIEHINQQDLYYFNIGRRNLEHTDSKISQIIQLYSEQQNKINDLEAKVDQLQENFDRTFKELVRLQDLIRE